MGHNVITADSHKLKAAGIGDVHIELSNRLKQTPFMLQGTIHTPEIAFMLISIGHLDKESCQVIFGKGVCTIHNHKGRVMVVIPHEDGLYQFAYGGPEHANIVLAKMSISEAHCKLCHIGHATICHTVSKGMITGIELDMELKSKFCKPYDEQVHTQCMYKICMLESLMHMLMLVNLWVTILNLRAIAYIGQTKNQSWSSGTLSSMKTIQH